MSLEEYMKCLPTGDMKNPQQYLGGAKELSIHNNSGHACSVSGTCWQCQDLGAQVGNIANRKLDWMTQ